MGILKFSEEESRQLAIAWGVMSLAFAVALGGGFGGIGEGLLRRIIIAAITVGTGFLLHEIGHKYMAQKYGFFAEFRSFSLGLLVALGLSFTGFIFAAPGAVYILGSVSTRENGIISAVGPLINIVLALIFLALNAILNQIGIFSPLAQAIVSYGFAINSWLAFFNLFPIYPLDGSKVFVWSFRTWLAMIVFSGFLAFFV